MSKLNAMEVAEDFQEMIRFFGEKNTRVAGHPVDRGMEHIAKRIMEKVKKIYE